MGLDFDVFEFCKKLRQNRPPPYQCPLEKCDKVYKSLCGLQYHLVNYDHDNPTPVTPAVPNNRKKGRFKAPVPTGDIALQSPPKEALTFAEAQRAVQFEIDGKISRIPIDQPLPIMSLEEWEVKNAELEKPVLFVEPQPEPHVKLPEAIYKVIPDYNERVADAPPRPNAYIRYIEKSAEELDGEVEYDVDEEDTAWLGIVNKMRAKQNMPPMSVDTLELLMDRLEKESYFQASQNGQQTQAVVDDDAVCCICMDGECQNTNVILFCDMCNLAVHQDCYGVPYIPEGQWLCRRCLQSPSRLVNCVLCPNTGGAFKQTDQGTWAHVVCALWIPEVRFANTVFLEPIDSIEMIPAARWKLACMVCKQRGAGACIQCHKTSCYHAFHVTCAQQAGLYMKMEAGTGRDPSQPVHVAKMAYCDAHTPAHVLQERRAQESEENNKPTDLSTIRQKGRDKIKQARRILAKKRTWAPVVLVPTLPPERVSEIAQLAQGPAPSRTQFMKKLLAYWTLKRHARNGVPLLRRLQSLTSSHGTRGIQDGTVNVRELCNQLKYWQRIRQDLERARLLCELVRKRERLKVEYVRVWERYVMHNIRPAYAILHKLMRLLRHKDSSDIFSEPVDLQEVPDYSTVVKHPMDLSTMSKKIDKGAYKTIDDVEEDFQLMINNCLTYNNKDTVFYKAGVKMREQCLQLFRQARRDVSDAGMPELAGVGDATVEPRRSPARSERGRSKSKSRVERDTSEDTSDRTTDTRSERAISRARSVRRQITPPPDSEDDTATQEEEEEEPVSATKKGNWWTNRGRRGRGRGRGRGRIGRPPSRPASRASRRIADTPTETATSESEAPPPPPRKSVERTPKKNLERSSKKAAERTPRKHVERTLKLSTPEKSPPRKKEPNKALGVIGGLRKPTLISSPTSTAAASKSFGSDASLPTLSASMGRTPTEGTPKKKGRGRPRKVDKDKAKSSPDLFGTMQGDSKPASTPVPASFLQYRGPPGEVGSDSDLALSRSSSSSSGWSQSCSSCTHYDDEDLSDHSRSSSSSDGSSYNETLDSTVDGSGTEKKRQSERERRTPSAPSKGRGTRSTTSKTPVKSSNATLQLEPLQLVWAKCRGYPWYPALIIDPKMPKGFVYNGVPLPSPPSNVLDLKKSQEPNVYLVLFFDAKRTWQWLPSSKLELLGIEKSTDQSKLVESRKPADRKAVKKAYSDAMRFRKEVDGDEK